MSSFIYTISFFIDNAECEFNMKIMWSIPISFTVRGPNIPHGSLNISGHLSFKWPHNFATFYETTDFIDSGLN